jgi:putative membrane protein
MKRQFGQFVVRCLLNAAGLFIAAMFLDGISYQQDWQVLVIAGLVLSIVNALIKPMVIILSLPALVLTVGLFSIVINGLMVYIAHLIYPPFQVASFGSAVLAGLVIGLVNYIVTRVFDVLAPDNHE